MKRSIAVAVLALAGSAHADTDARKVGAFTGIEIAGTMTVTARIDTATKVEVVGDADLVKLVSTTVKNGVLVVDTPKDFIKRLDGRKNVKLDVVVSAPDISRVTISGTGTIDLAGVAAKTFDASIPGTGGLHLKGKTEKLRLVISGTGEVKAKGLLADAVDLRIPGTAEASLHATKSFESDVSGVAAVKVHGKPASVKKSGNGLAAIDVD